MSKLIMGDDRCHLEESDIDFLWTVDAELSFEIQGAEHSNAFKVGWDGTNKLLNSDDLSFSRGLQPRVEEWYEQHNRELEVIDNRSKKTPVDWYVYPEVIAKLQARHIVPYPHQIAAVNAIKTHDRGIIRVATGGGKSIIAALIIAELSKNSIVYVIGKDLLYQMHELFENLFPWVKVGIIGDGKCEIGQINIVSVWTAGCALGIDKGKILYDTEDEAMPEPTKYASIRQALLDAEVHILDECHVAACNTIQEISRNIKPEHIYGMSASPWRDDGADLLIESVLGRPIVDIPASVLIKQGLLVKPFIQFRPVPPIDNLPKSFPSIYKKYVVENDVRNEMIVQAVKEMVAAGHSTLVLYNSINHGRILQKEISKHVRCLSLSGNDSLKLRQDARRQLVKKEIDCIVASKIFDLGINIPSLSGLIIAGCGKSSVRALQRIGRVIRRCPQKTKAVVIDFVDDAAYLEEHAQARRRIYSSEEEFQVQWSKNVPL